MVCITKAGPRRNQGGRGVACAAVPPASTGYVTGLNLGTARNIAVVSVAGRVSDRQAGRLPLVH